MVSRYLLSNNAKDDLENIFSYISENLKNIDSALKLINRFEDKFLSLISFPYAYPVIDNIHLDKNDLRKCYIDNYLIIYSVNKNLEQIEIVRIIYQRVDYLKEF